MVYSLVGHNKERQAINAKHVNLFIQITELENKINYFLRIESKRKTFYETEYLSSDDIAQIRGYLKKYNVYLPK